MYDELIKCLQRDGIFAYLQKPEQLVISTAFPNVPTANSFWVTRIREQWYLSTFLPAVYRVPSGQNISDVCIAVLRSSATAIYRVDDNCVERYGLEEVSAEEADALLDEHFGKSEDEPG